VHQIARGLSKDGKELVYLELQMYVGAKDPADTLTLTGHPTISLTIPGGSPGDIANSIGRREFNSCDSRCASRPAHGARFADRVLFS